MISNGFHKCKTCIYAIKCRMISHHIAYMFAEDYTHEDFIELLEYF